MKKRSGILMAVLILFMIVPSCFGGAKQEAKPGNVALTFMSNVSSAGTVDYLKEIVAGYKKEGVTINYEAITGSTTEYQERLETMFAGGVFPDVLYIPTLWSKRHAAMNHAYDLTDILPKEVINDYFDGPLAAVTYNGRIIGLPYTTDCLDLYYNKAMIQKAGIRLPASQAQAWTWEQFIDVVKTVQKANGTRYGVTIGADFSHYLPFFWQTGATVLNEKQDKVTVNQPGTIRMLNWFRNEWVRGGLCSPEVILGVENNTTLFVQGITPFVVTYSGSVGGLIEDVKDFEFGITYLPKDKTAANKIGGWNMEVINKTKNPEAALELFRYLTDTAQMNTYCAATSNMPTRKSSQQTIQFKPALAPHTSIIMEELAAVPAFATNDCVTPAYQTYKNLLAAEFSNFIITPSVTAEVAAAEMEKQINQALFK
jgi:ABC-type glycerol-3-phosphate transport system substrate-binding protein